MRYIDADALKERVHEIIYSYKPPRIPKGEAEHIVKMFLIDAAPTADVAPVVHGKWILVCANAHHYEILVEEKCSVCGRYVYRYDTQPQDSFCPNCGARMDGGT